MRFVFALDLGMRTGFACGGAGACPTSGAVVLKQRDEPAGRAGGNLMEWLRRMWMKDRPDIVAIEAPFNLAAFSDKRASDATVRMAFGLTMVVAAMCDRYGIAQPIEAQPSTVRKHFIGRGRIGDRDAMKAAVIRRCHMLKLLPPDSADDDRADAIAIHDWASAHYANRSFGTANLVLFEDIQRRGKYVDR
jgi:Holliday junction resolvasome RuvABC endonuclease subunit